MPPKIPAPTTPFICPQCLKHLTSPKRRRFLSSTTTKLSTTEIYDVVAVGGGPAGLALLAALKSSPVTSHLKTALVETQDLAKLRAWSSPEDKYSNRASSLTPSSVAFIEGSGAWKYVDQSRVQAYDEMQVWDGANNASLQFDWSKETRKYNAPPKTVATMTENSNLTKGLLERIFELGAGDSLLSNTSVSSISHGEDDPRGLNLSTWPILTLESRTASASPTPRSIAARLLVGADGFNSPVRSFAGISSHGWDYDRHGVVATLTTEPSEDLSATDTFDLFSSEPLPNRATAYQRFLPALGGPIAVLPLPNNRASMVWSTTPSNAAYLKSLPPPAQTAIINAALRLSQTDIQYLFTLPPSPNQAHADELTWRLQHTPPPPHPLPLITSIQESTLASFPLRFRHASSLTSPRIALIGDAAHTIHPLAGQGLNLGLADASSLANTIAYATQRGMDIGDSFALEKYNTERFGKGLLMAGGVDALNWIYQAEGRGEGVVSSLVGHARGWGMRALGIVPGMRELIMKQAS